MNVRVLREAGGIGDVLCTLPAIRGIREKYPDATIWAYCLEGYDVIFRHCPDVDEVVVVGLFERRGRDEPLDTFQYPYLRETTVKFDQTYDFFCPAFHHELKTGGKVKLGRIDLYARYAGIVPSDWTPHFEITVQEHKQADVLLRRLGLADKTVLGVQPHPASRVRSWPHWKRFLGMFPDVLVFAETSKQLEAEGLQDLPAVVGEDLGVVAALIQRCKCFVGVDSALYHLSAAVGIPAVGLFGPTNGETTSRHYPLHTYLTAPLSNGLFCDPPCYCFQGNGYNNSCMKTGCKWMAQLTPERVHPFVADELYGEASGGGII